MGTYKANRNNLEEVPEKSEREKKQESTEKLVDLAGETALDVYTGGQFSNVKGMVEKVPVAGKVANKTWNKAVKGVSKIASKTPIGNIAKKADDAGITDTARSAKNMVNITKGNPGSSSDIASNTSKVNVSLKSNSDANINQQGNSSKSKGLLDFLDSGNKEGLLGNLPKGLKIKLIVGCGAVFLFMIICIGVFASDDVKNLSLTDGSNMSSKSSSANSEELLARLEDLANYFIENAGEYNQGAYLYVPQLDASIRKDCTGFAVAYMSYVSGVDLPESYTGEMVEINGSWAKKAMDAGWQAFTAEEIGDASNLQPGDVLIEHTSGSNGHAEIYVDSTHTFGWGSKQSHYPLDKTIVNTSTGSKVRFGDGYHKEYRVVYRYMNATSSENIDIADLNITKMNDSSFNHGVKAKSNQKYIVLHDTDMLEDATTVVNSWKNNGNGVAAHFVINRDGTVIQAVDLDVITHHAGWGGPGNYDQKFGVGNNDGNGNGDDLVKTVPLSGYTSYGMNSYSIGIEICHKKDSGEDYTESQFESLDKIIQYIDSYYGFESTIIDHKTWRPSNGDVDDKFPLNKYKTSRHH